MSDIYSAVWRQIDATIYIVHTTGDPLTGRVELVSGGAFRMLGYQPDQFVEDPGLWHRLMHPDDVPRVVEETQRIFSRREPCTRMYRLKHAVSGQYRWIEDAAVPLCDEQGSLMGIAGVARDITALKQTEHELQRRMNQLETLIEAMPDGVLVADYSGRILRTNAGLEQMLGWSQQELAGRSVDDLLPERFRTGHARLRTQYSAAPRIRRMGATDELVALHKNGSEVPVDIMLSSVPDVEGDRVLAVIRDMTEARRAQRGLALLSSIVKSADESIVGTDLNGQIVSWNRGAEQLFGYAEGEVVGKQVILTYPQDRQDECMDSLSRIGLRERPPRHESRRVRKDGSQIEVSVILSPIEDSHGRLLGMSSMCRDITKRKAADAALQVAKQAAEIASQTKSEFLANMGHELRTPLNGIIGLTALVLDSELNEEQRDHLKLVKTSAESLLRILSGILEISKIQAGQYVLQPMQFHLRDLINTTIQQLGTAATEKQLQLTCHIEPGVPEAMVGDAGCLRQILANLVENAIKFTDAGEVAVTVEAAPEAPGTLHFAVRDTGIGVAPDKQRMIFTPFCQADSSSRRRFGGTGLGLAICTQLAEMMGGRISAESDGQTGSTFSFTIRMEAVR